MAVAKIEVACAADTTLPRDRVVNTLYFDVGFDVLNPFSTDWNGLASDMADIYDQHWHNTPREINVRVYDTAGDPPHYPIGSKDLNVGSAPASQMPREVALCLSFYADRNIPRHRGRIYLPMCTGNQNVNAVRPDVDVRARAIAMAGHFSNLGGTNVDWQVWSGRDNQGRKVTHAWVDDEWDTVRRRGLRPTTRTSVTVDE